MESTKQKGKKRKVKSFWRVQKRSLNMKILLACIALSLLTGFQSQAQTWKEFFKQKKTQIKYLGQQLAALQVYAGYLKQGYEIAASGLGTIRDITNDEFNLHSGFINSLKIASPAIAHHAQAAEIIAFQFEINKAFSGLKRSPYLSAGNRDYISRVKQEVMKEYGKDLEELLLAVTSGRMEMNDNERLERLDKVYKSMKDKQAFTQYFINNVHLLIQQRAGEQKSINQTRSLYETNQ